jgi:hypothetical protein
MCRLHKHCSLASPICGDQACYLFAEERSYEAVKDIKWDAEEVADPVAWDSLFAGKDKPAKTALVAECGRLCYNVLALRNVGGDVWLNVSASKSSDLPLLTVRVSGVAKYASGDTPAELLAAISLLSGLLEAALTA